jgi:hypothetical protein
MSAHTRDEMKLLPPHPSIVVSLNGDSPRWKRSKGTVKKTGAKRMMKRYTLAHITYGRFYYNHRYAAATGLDAFTAFKRGRLTARSVNILRQVCLPPLRLRMPRHGRLTDSPASTNVALIILRAVYLAWRLGGFVTNRHE